MLRACPNGVVHQRAPGLVQSAINTIDFTSTSASCQVRCEIQHCHHSPHIPCCVGSTSHLRISEANHCRTLSEIRASGELWLQSVEAKNVKITVLRLQKLERVQCGSRRCQGRGVPCSVESLESCPFNTCCCTPDTARLSAKRLPRFQHVST